MVSSLADNRPQLDEKSLQRVLRVVRRTGQLPEHHPFHSFLIFRKQMQQPERLRGPLAHLDAITEWLERVFADLLREDDLSSGDDVDRLAQAFQSDNDFRSALTWLYFRYMRPDLDLAVDAAARRVNADRRTINRREALGLRHLAAALIREETDFRRQHILTMLRGRIPLGRRELLGREWIVERALATLESNQEAVLLVGMPGIGKTTIASQIALAYLPQVEDLYWLDASPEMDCAAHIAELLSPAAGRELRSDLMSYLISKRVLLVLEGIQSQHLHSLRAPSLRHAALLCTSDKRLPDWDGVVLNIPPLDEDAARHYYDFICGDAPQTDFATVFQQSDGVPEAMREILHKKNFLPAERVKSKLSPEAYFARTWQAASPFQQRLWLVATLAASRGLTLWLAESLLDASEPDIAELVSSHVLMMDAESSLYHITPLAAAHIARQLMDDGPLDAFAEAVIARSDINYIQMQFLQHLLRVGLAEWFTEAVGRRLLNALAVRVAKLGLWEAWAGVWENLGTVRCIDASWLELWRNLEAARQKRWHGELAESFRMLQVVVQEARSHAFSDLYGRCLLEMSIIASLREDWPTASEAAEDAESTFAQLQWDSEQAQAVLVGARALIPTDPHAALARIEPLTAKYDNAASLACELSLEIGHLDDAVYYANQAVNLTEPDTPNYGRALSMLALSLHADGHFEDALDCQQEAINVLGLRTTKDVLGLARAYNNLGVIQYSLKEIDKARNAWQAALDLLRALQDAAGLRVVRANLKLSDDGSATHLL
jgi:tetratricopeptide (TPR) repeat protein